MSATENTTQNQACSIPCNPSLTEGDHCAKCKDLDLVDSLNRTLGQAKAILVILQVNGEDYRDGFRVPHESVMAALWNVEELVVQSKTVADSWWEECKQCSHSSKRTPKAVYDKIKDNSPDSNFFTMAAHFVMNQKNTTGQSARDMFSIASTTAGFKKDLLMILEYEMEEGGAA